MPLHSQRCPCPLHSRSWGLVHLHLVACKHRCSVHAVGQCYQSDTSLSYSALCCALCFVRPEGVHALTGEGTWTSLVVVRHDTLTQGGMGTDRFSSDTRYRYLRFGQKGASITRHVGKGGGGMKKNSRKIFSRPQNLKFPQLYPTSLGLEGARRIFFNVTIDVSANMGGSCVSGHKRPLVCSGCCATPILASYV